MIFGKPRFFRVIDGSRVIELSGFSRGARAFTLERYVGKSRVIRVAAGEYDIFKACIAGLIAAGTLVEVVT